MAVGISRFQNEETGKFLECDMSGNIFTSQCNESDAQLWQVICQPNTDVLLINIAYKFFLDCNNEFKVCGVQEMNMSCTWDWMSSIIKNKTSHLVLDLDQFGKVCLKEKNGLKSQNWISC